MQLARFLATFPGRQLPCSIELRRGKLLSAVYRVGPYAPATGTPQGYALRLLVEPMRAATSPEVTSPVAVAN